MQKLVLGAALAVVFAAVVADARPALQPVVKDYQEVGEAFEVSSLKVFHQDQEQCAI